MAFTGKYVKWKFVKHFYRDLVVFVHGKADITSNPTQGRVWSYIVEVET